METMSVKVGAVGGNKGATFDDGVFDGVKKVTVGKDFHSVTYIKIEYEKDGKSEIREHGTIRGELKEFSVDYPNEYITSVGGSYDNVFTYGSVLIKSLIFKTSYGRTSPILGHTTLLGNPAGKEFMLEGKNGGKLLGFHGRSGQALDAIGPHFFAVDSSLKHFNLQGGNGGRAWDDGAFDGVRKVLVGRNGKFVSYVRFEYAKGERMVPHAHGKKQEAPQEFLVDYPNEHITSVEGTIDGYLTSLKFKTSKGRTSPAFGNVVGSKFVFEETGFKLVGFCGRSGDAIDALGAHFSPLPTPVPKNIVTKIYISSSNGGIEQIKFDSVEKGETKEGFLHGVKGKNVISTVAISNYPDDYLVYVESWYDPTNVFQGIKFKTDKNTSEFFGYKLSEDDGTPFSLHVKDKKITGFTRFADSNLNSPGTYFVLNHSALAPPNKVEAQGGNGGATFDDGAFDHVRKVYVGQGDSGVAYVKFDYEKDGKRETREHGKMTLLGTEEFAVDSDDYITSIEVSVDNVFGFKSEIVTALVFKTFKAKTSQPFGMVTEKKFELKDGNGGKLAGFHGNASHVLYALGAYFTPTTTSSSPLTPSTATKLQARGGNGGASWDDGVFDGVRKILVGQGNDGVAFVTFEYNKGSQPIIGDGHGKQTLLGTETFELDYPSEYITSVEGYYDKIFGVEAEVVTSLTFKTNKRTSQPFGLTAGERFELKEEGYKIVGFHGKAGDLVHQIGVHIVPIFTSYRITL